MNSKYFCNKCGYIGDSSLHAGCDYFAAYISEEEAKAKLPMKEKRMTEPTVAELIEWVEQYDEQPPIWVDDYSDWEAKRQAIISTLKRLEAAPATRRITA